MYYLRGGSRVGGRSIKQSIDRWVEDLDWTVVVIVKAGIEIVPVNCFCRCASAR